MSPRPIASGERGRDAAFAEPARPGPAAPGLRPERRVLLRRAGDRSEAQAKARSILQALPDGVIWLEPQEPDEAPEDFVVRQVNPAGAALLRLPPERVVGRTLSELLDTEAHPDPLRVCLEVWATGQSAEVTLRLPSGCGRERQPWFRFQVRALDDGLLVVAREVTAGRATERALALAEARLRQTQAMAHVGSWSHDDRTGRQWWSQEIWHILGADPAREASRYATVLQRVHPEDVEEFKAVVRGALRAGRPFSHELRLERPQGGPRVVCCEGEVERDARGRPVGYVGMVQDLTHIRAAEQRARESEQLRRRILGQLPLILFALDADGTVVFSEGIGLARQGLQPADVLGRPVFETYADSPDFLNAIRRALAGESLVAVSETRGAVFQRWLEPTRDADGRVSGVIGVSLDVTERHRAEQERSRAEAELRTSQALLRTVINRLPQGVYVKDLEGRFVMVNEPLARFHRLQPEAMLQRTSFGVPSLSGPLAQKMVAQDARIVATGQSLTGEVLSVVRADGVPRWIRISKMPLRDAQGQVIRIVGLVEDITDRKRIQDELEQSRALLQAIFDTFPARIKVEACNGRQLLINRAQAEASGLPDPAAADEAVTLGLDGAEREQRREENRRVVQEGQRFDYERQRTGPDGQAIHERIMRVPLTDADGHVRGVLNVGIDITEHKTTELQLRQAQKMEAMGQLAGGVAHDFNNLLQIIQGYGQLALQGADGRPRLLQALGQVLGAADRAGHLTRQLLTFSRRQVLQPRKVELNALVEELLRMLRRLIGEHIVLRHRPAPSRVCIRADRGMVEQVLVNLCVNARDAMPHGGELTLCTDVVQLDEAFCRLHELQCTERYALLTVTDTGGGIPHEDLQRIFEPFFTTKPEGQGTGLGLSIAYGIVRQHGGTLRAHSEPERGTTFSLYLPAIRCGRAPQAELTETVAGGTETLLVAEDEEHVLGLLTELLRSQGYEVLTARDGEEALAVLEEHREQIDLAVLDVMMPKLGGREVIERMRARVPGVRILLSTGYPAHAIDADFLHTHGLTVIEKPYSPYELFKAVRAVLDADRA